MSKQFAMGIDIGGTNIKYMIIDNAGKEIDVFSNKTESEKGRNQILKNAIDGANTLLEKNKKIKVLGIGIGSPGLISKDGKVITGAENFKDWNGTDIKGTLEKAIGLPVFVDNDVTVLALGEAYFGAGKNNSTVLCAALGTGLGGGIVINDHLFRGKYGYAAEFGHIILNPQGPSCTCGKRGCLEAYASANGLKQLAKMYIPEGSKTKILELAGSMENITPVEIFKAYRKKDDIAVKIVNEMSYHLGWGMGILVNIFDPDIIVIAGGLSQEGQLLLDVIYKHLYDFTMPFYRNKINIKLSKFMEKSGVIGSASLVFEKLNIKVG